MAEKPQRQAIKKQQPPSYIADVAASAEKGTEKPAHTAAPSVPRRRRRVIREQVSTRILAEIRDVADEYMDATGTTFQALVEAALTEYLENAGYTVGSGR